MFLCIFPIKYMSWMNGNPHKWNANKYQLLVLYWNSHNYVSESIIVKCIFFHYTDMSILWRPYSCRNLRSFLLQTQCCPDSKVHGANIGPIWANRTQVGPMLAPWTCYLGDKTGCFFYCHCNSLESLPFLLFHRQNSICSDSYQRKSYKEIYSWQYLLSNWI